MPDRYDFDLDPVSFITVGALGPAGQRTFFLQGAQRRVVVSLVIEKEHAIALAVNLNQLIEDLAQHDPGHGPNLDPPPRSMALVEPMNAAFRVDSIGIGVDAERHVIILVANEMVDEDEETPARRARFVASYGQVLALARHAADVVQQGRPVCPLCGQSIDPDGHFCPPRNGHPRAIGD